jgi:predicted amidohydrolase
MTTTRIAAAQWPIQQVGTVSAWQTKLRDWLTQAADEHASLCIIPEYASMELTSVLEASEQSDLQSQLKGLQRLLPEYRSTYARLASQLHITVVAGSFPEFDASVAIYRNIARVFVGARNEQIAVHKLQMTRFEREQWFISGGHAQPIIETPSGRVGVAICYDSEFPMIARRLAVAGADIICVPSCTDSIAGYQRVRIGCQARALENQCYVVQAPTVGSAPWSIAVDQNIGAAAIYAPPDRGFPDDGIIAIGAMNQAQWVYGDVDLSLLAQVRNDGSVLGYRDWDNPAHLGG